MLADRAALPFQSPAVGIVEIRGVITESDDVVEVLKRFGENEGIAAVVLRVESPGGAVGPSQEIYQAVAKLRDQKPVVASLGGIAASGGYYVAAPSLRIFANPGSLTGSIGVIMAVRNVQGVADWIGVKESVIKSGPFKDIANPMRTMSEEERGILQGMVDDVHAQFVAAVAAGRGLPEATVRGIADGRLYSGAQAHALGLVDELGGFEDAVQSAARAGGIDGEPRTVWGGPRRRFGLAEWLGGLAGVGLVDVLPRRLPPGLLFLYLGHELEAR